jgi:hypothetical protein
MTRSLWRRAARASESGSTYYWVGEHPHREVRAAWDDDRCAWIWELWVEARSGMSLVYTGRTFDRAGDGKHAAEALTMADRL